MQLLLSLDSLVIFGLCTDFFFKNLEKEALNILKGSWLVVEVHVVSHHNTFGDFGAERCEKQL